MSKSRKRRPDFRKIRPSKVYSLPEIAKDLNRDIATVRRWVRDGLPTLDGQGQTLVLGSELKAWLKAKWSARKRPCGLGEIYCCGCHAPTKPKSGSAYLQPKTDKTVTIKGVCSKCGAPQSQTGSLSKIDQIKADFGFLPQDMQHLTGCSNPGIKHTSNRCPVVTPTGGGGGGQISEAFEDSDRRGCEPAINQYRKTSPILKGRNHDEKTS